MYKLLNQNSFLKATYQFNLTKKRRMPHYIHFVFWSGDTLSVNAQIE